MRRSLPKAFGRDPRARRVLAALVLRDVDEAGDPGHQRRVEAGGDELAAGHVPLDVGLDERVEHLVGRQRLVVALVGPQLGRRRLREHRLGHDLAAGALVHVAAQVVDEELRDVGDDGEAAGGVAVERRVADGELGLVAGREHEPAAVGVGERHQQRAADPGLEVLVGEAGRLADDRREHLPARRRGPARSAIVRWSMPRASARRSASVREWSELNRLGIDTVCTWSAPRASTAMHVTSDESTPPDSPMTTSVKPFFTT